MRHRAQIPPPPPADAEIFSLPMVAGFLTVSLAKVKTLRRTDPTFPMGRKIGEELRWLRTEVKAWFLAQPQGWSAMGGRNLRRGRFMPKDAPEAADSRADLRAREGETR